MSINAPIRTGISASITLLLFSFLLSATLAHGAEDRFDGKWRMNVTYSKSASSDARCMEDLLADPMIIKNGKLSGLLNSAGRRSCRMRGTVTQNGELRNAKCVSSSEYVVKGRIGRNAGKGSWKNVSSEICDGLWTAKRIK